MRVRIHVGAAAAVLPTLVGRGPFDLVFIDADKEGYPGYLAWAADNLRPGGVVLLDNAFLFGHLPEPATRRSRHGDPRHAGRPRGARARRKVSRDRPADGRRPRLRRPLRPLTVAGPLEPDPPPRSAGGGPDRHTRARAGGG